MKTAIISGITGQDGALLASLLLSKKYRVMGLVDQNRTVNKYRLEFLRICDQVFLTQIDFSDRISLQHLFEETKPDEFYNLAAISSVGLSFNSPYETFHFNTNSVINILEAIRQVSPGTKFYQASSSEMFGNIGSHQLPVVESFLFHPVSPYGISKASAHWLTVNYREAFKMKTCCGILFNHESALRPLNFVIKKITRTALKIKSGEETKITLGNTSVVRDWGYAPLYVDAMWRMLQKEKLDDYLICSGKPIALTDFVNKMFAALDLDAKEYVVKDASLMRKLDLEAIYGDNSRAKKELGWEYDVSTDDLIRRLINDEIEVMKWEGTNP